MDPRLVQYTCGIQRGHEHIIFLLHPVQYICTRVYSLDRFVNRHSSTDTTVVLRWDSYYREVLMPPRERVPAAKKNLTDFENRKKKVRVRLTDNGHSVLIFV